ncbi:MAG: hypothetical protein K6F42_06250 [Bacteroidales bacterium]|nr:hypothetical protein [Bacteroidales bacterium]
MKTQRVLLLLAAVLLAGPLAYASGPEAGLKDVHFTAGIFHSPKGIGGSFRFGGQNALAVYADMEEVYAGRALYPGLRVSWLHPLPLAKKTARDGSVFTFYAGPGLTGGYVRDKGEWYGFMAGVSLGAGVSVGLRERFVLSLELEGSAALQLSKNTLLDSWVTHFYRNGWRQALYPQLKIEYRF